MTKIPHDLAAQRIINAAGTLTRLSGARVSAEVAEAMAQAAQGSFDMWGLQAAASRRIADATGADAGLVTTGAAAGLTLAAAAVIAGLDPKRMQALPATEGMANEILVPRMHRNSYDRALAAAGARLVDIGTGDRETDAGVRGLEAWEVEAGITPRTVALLANASPATERDIPLLAEVGRMRGLALIVDAAAQLPPADGLKRPIALGASLVVFSGGKAIGGPQASGILAGSRALIASAALQMLDMDVRPDAFRARAELFGDAAPSALPRHGIGRGFKASKEAIVGLLVALDAFRTRDEAAAGEAMRGRIERVRDMLAGCSGVAVEIVPGRRAGGFVRLAIRMTSPQGAVRASATVRRLGMCDPPVHVGEGRLDEGVIVIDLIATAPEDDAIVARAIAAALAAAGECA